MGKGKRPPRTHCKQCKETKRPEDFLPARRRGWRVTICNACAQGNMRKWEATRNVGLMPEDITDAGD